jgi:hypothetical protein
METKALGTYSRVEAWTKAPDKSPAAASASSDGSAEAEAARVRTRTLGFTFGKLGVRYVSRIPEPPVRPEATPSGATRQDGTGTAGSDEVAWSDRAAGAASSAKPDAGDASAGSRLFDAQGPTTLADSYGPYRTGATFPASIPAPTPNSPAAAGASDDAASGLDLRRGLTSYRRALSARLDVPPRMLDGMV